jgi:hypothetical protein
LCTALIGLVAVWWGAGRTQAHQTVVSRFTFHRDVQPILERRCAGCHVSGGAASTPLLRYEDARVATWPMRQTVTAGTMPPWFGESGLAALKDPQALTAQELNVLMTWAAGGAPEGAAVATPTVSPAPIPAPDVVISMPEPFIYSVADPVEHEVVLPAEAVRGKWIRAVNVIPGTPSIVRGANVVVRSAAGEQTLGVWVPGDPVLPLEGGGAVFVPSDGSLRVRIRYVRRRGDVVEAPVEDRSAVAVYFADGADATPVVTLELSGPSYRLDRTVRAVALEPVAGPVHATINYVVTSPGGARTPLLRVQNQPEWRRRYVFVAPVPLEAGSRIETRVEPSEAGLWLMLSKSGLMTSTNRPVTPADEINRARLEIIP